MFRRISCKYVSIRYCTCSFVPTIYLQQMSAIHMRLNLS